MKTKFRQGLKYFLTEKIHIHVNVTPFGYAFFSVSLFLLYIYKCENNSILNCIIRNLIYLYIPILITFYPFLKKAMVKWLREIISFTITPSQSKMVQKI